MANNRDVQLVVKARDEASRAIDAVAGSITKLLERQTAAGSSASVTAGKYGEMAVALAEIEKANGLVAGAANQAESAFKRQSSTLAETQAQLQATRAQIENVGKAVAAAQTKLVDIKIGGGDTSPIIAQIAGADAALKNLIATEGRLSQSVKSQETALGLQRSSLQQLSSMANTTEAALRSLGDENERAALKGKAAREKETDALLKKAAAEREAAAAKESAAAAKEAAARETAAAAAQAQQIQDTANAAQRLRDRIDPLAAIQNKLNRELADARTLYKQGAIGALELAKAESVLAKEADDARAALDRVGKGSKGAVGLFGLKPYEMTNLGYQINDVVTQLASGTSLTQTLAQQGGQILQLLPNIGTRMIAAFTNPAVLGGIATIGTLAVVFSKASAEADRLRKIEGMLAGIADGGNLSAESLNLTAQALEKIGLSGEESLNQIRTFVTQGLNPDYLISFSKAALDVATITGSELPEAADMMREAFTSGYDAVAKLDDQFQFLTVSEREQIRAMFDSGRAAEGRETAFRAFAESLRDSRKASDEAKGAVESLGSAVNEFLNALARTDVIQGFANNVRETFQTLAREIRALSDAATIEDLDAKIAMVGKQIAKIKAGKFLYIPGVENFEYKQALLLNSAQAGLNELLKQRADLQKKVAQADGDTVNQKAAAIKKRRAETLEQLELERKLALTSDDRERARLLGDAAYRDEIKKTGDTVVADARRRAAVEIALHAARMKRAKEVQMIELGSPLRGDFPISSGYSMNRKHPITGKTSAHPAVDYKTPVGTPVYASAAGSVTGAEIKGGNGLYTKINHGGGTESYYLHMDEVLVEVGQWVEKGQKIGMSGGNPLNADGSKNAKAGNSTGAHLDYRVKVDGEFVDPTKVRRVKGDPEKALAEALKAQDKLLEQQDDFNEKLDAEAEKRRLTTAFMHEQMGLSGEALLEARKRASVEEAVLQAQQNAAKAGLVLDDARLKTIRETVAAEWDMANARDRATFGVNDISGERQALLDRLATTTQLGDTMGAAELETQIDAIDRALSGAIDKAIQFWSVFNTPEARTAIAGLQNLRDNLKLDDRNRGRAQVEKPLNDLQAMRSALQDQIQFYKELGQFNVVESLREQLRGYDAETLVAIESSLEFWKTQTGPDAQAAILNLQKMRTQIQAASNEFAISAGQIQQVFAGLLSDAVTRFTERLTETRNPIRALGEAVAQLGSQFFQKISDMILQMLALRVAMKIGFGGMANGINDMFGAQKVKDASQDMIFAAGVWQLTAARIQAAAASLAASAGAGGGGGGGGGGLLGSLLSIGSKVAMAYAGGGISNASIDSMIASNAGIFHSGGIAGSGNRSRAVAPHWFANATRYHRGGVAGLAANEVPAILEKGEEILTRADARHRFNGGGMGGAAPEPKVDLKIVNAFDSASVLEQALNSRTGQKVMMNFMRANSRAVNGAMQEG